VDAIGVCRWVIHGEWGQTSNIAHLSPLLNPLLPFPAPPTFAVERRARPGDSPPGPPAAPVMKALPILYIKRGCPWCREAMAYFSQHGVELDVRDVNASAANLHRLIEISGNSLTPTFEYGEFVVADFSVNEFLDELEQVPDLKRELGLGDDED
jgi:glutaredoxin